MKQREPIRRHTPLQRAAGDFIRRTRIKPVSAKRQREAIGRAAVRSAVYERDDWRCALSDPATRPIAAGRCDGHTTVHHLLKQSQGGEYVPENLLTMCARHNDWVEEEPKLAWAIGLVVRRGESHEDAKLRRKAARL